MVGHLTQRKELEPKVCICLVHHCQVNDLKYIFDPTLLKFGTSHLPSHMELKLLRPGVECSRHVLQYSDIMNYPGTTLQIRVLYLGPPPPPPPHTHTHIFPYLSTELSHLYISFSWNEIDGFICFPSIFLFILNNHQPHSSCCEVKSLLKSHKTTLTHPDRKTILWQVGAAQIGPNHRPLHMISSAIDFLAYYK